MPIIRIKKRENPYVQIDRAALEDNRLSWRSRGILAYLLSKPDEWHIQVFDIMNHGTEGREAVQKALKELQKYGYAKLQPTRGEGGKVAGKEWVITEEPINGFSVGRFSPTNGITDVGENRRSGNPLYSNNNKESNNKSLSDSQAKSDMGKTFEELWQAYGVKRGSKKNALAKWSKLTAEEQSAIWATLETYKRETVTEDSADRAGRFKPMRKHLERFLSARTWEAYSDLLADQKTEQPTAYDEPYQKYLAWVGEYYPAALKSTAQLSRAQFIEFKSTSYVPGVRDIGTAGEMSMFRQAHSAFAEGAAVARKFSDIYEYHCSLIEHRIKIRQV